MAAYQFVETLEMILRTADNVRIPNAVGNRDWDEYQKWRNQGNTPDPYVAPVVVPPTLDEIYDQTLLNERVLKAVVLALNDGSLVPGSNRTPAALRTIIKAKM